MRWRTIGLAVVAVGAVAGGAAWYLFRPPVVTVTLATYAPVSEVVYGNGTVEPVRWAKVVPFTRRRIVELCRCEGQSVRQGQILARQDDGEEQAALNELNARLEQLERDLDKSNKDVDKGTVTKQQNEQLKTQVRELNFRISAQKERLAALVLKAPLDGMVLRRDGEVGEIAGPTDVLFWVGPPLPMQVVAEVNEEEINRIAVGQKAFLRSEAFAGMALRASVSQITPKGDPTRKTFRVYLLLPNDTPLRIGMSVEANIIFREKSSAIVVPAEAVSGDAVQTVNNGKLERVPVRVGIRGSRNVEVIGDVSRGMTVLSPARSDLAEGTRVRAEPNKTATPPQDIPVDGTPDQPQANSSPASTSAAAAPTLASADPDNAVISQAISAHIDSVVNDARRNVSRLGANR